MSLGELLRAAREQRGVDRDQLARRARLSDAQLAALESSDGETDRTAFARLFTSLGAPALQRPRLDDEALIARQRDMTISMRIASGFELCEFAAELASSKHR